jgi:hypothetical protein
VVVGGVGGWGVLGVGVGGVGEGEAEVVVEVAE